MNARLARGWERGMGACTTKWITRKKAIALMIQVLNNAQDDELRQILNFVIGDPPLIEMPGYHLNRFAIGEEPEDCNEPNPNMTA